MEAATCRLFVAETELLLPSLNLNPNVRNLRFINVQMSLWPWPATKNPPAAGAGVGQHFNTRISCR